VNALKAKKNSDATPNKPFDPFSDHSPMMDPDPEINKAFQYQEMFTDDLKNF
jgi:hypothetical protein